MNGMKIRQVQPAFVQSTFWEEWSSRLRSRASLSPPSETPQWAVSPGPSSLLAPLCSPLSLAFDF